LDDLDYSNLTGPFQIPVFGKGTTPTSACLEMKLGIFTFFKKQENKWVPAGTKPATLAGVDIRMKTNGLLRAKAAAPEPDLLRDRVRNSPAQYFKPSAPAVQRPITALEEMQAMRVTGSSRRFSPTPVRDDAPPEFYTVSQLARRLQFTKMTIHRMVTRGELPCYLFGRVKRFHYKDVETFLDRCRTRSVCWDSTESASSNGGL
jgi:excisionase family DNA binding protein